MVPYYYPRVIERVAIGIADLFNDVKINRYDEENNVVKIIEVPLTHHYSKNFAQFVRNTQRVKESSHQVPIMGLTMKGMERDTARTTQQNYIRKLYDKDQDRFLRDRRPSTWKLNYTLTLYAENIIDYTQMIENIVTYFDPTLTVSIKEFENINIERDLIVTLENVSLNFEDEVDRTEIQSYSADLNLSVAVVLYPPTSGAAIIKHIQQNILSKGRAIGHIMDDGFHPANISDYNKAMGEIVTEGSLVPSYVVNHLEEAGDNFNKITVSVLSPSEVVLTNLLGGVKVVYVEVLVSERFNSLVSSMSIGTDSNPTKYLKTDENNLYFTAKYAISMEIPVNAEEEVKVFLNKASATEGTAYVSIAWN